MIRVLLLIVKNEDSNDQRSGWMDQGLSLARIHVKVSARKRGSIGRVKVILKVLAVGVTCLTAY